MGQSLSQSPSQPISSNTQTHLERRFFVSAHPVYTNSPEFKLLHQKLTNKKYILRVMTLNDQLERAKLEDSIFRKIANKSQYLPRLEHYIFQDFKGYCGTVTKCYLFFELGQFTTLREEVLKQPNHRAPFNQEQLIKGMQNLMFGLLWLKYFHEPHGNINTLNIYCSGGLIFLSDPLIAPSNNENPERYISPQKQQKMDNQLQQFDPYVSDVFAIGMCMLQVIKLGKMDKMYKRNGKLNIQLLIEQLNKCKFQRLKELLQKMLIGGNTKQFRQSYLQSFSKKFNISMAVSQTVSEKTNKIHSIGGIKRAVKSSQAESAFITANDVNKMKFNRDKSKPKLGEIEPMGEPQEGLYRIYPKAEQGHYTLPRTTNEADMKSYSQFGTRPLGNVQNYGLSNLENVKKYGGIGRNDYSSFQTNKSDLNGYQPSSYRPFSMQKLIPTVENLATPIRYIPSYVQPLPLNSYLPLSHRLSYQKQQIKTPLGFGVGNSSFGSYLNNGYTQYKSRLTPMQPKVEIGSVAEHSFPKRISPIKKYSENGYDELKRSSSKKQATQIEVKNQEEKQKQKLQERPQQKITPNPEKQQKMTPMVEKNEINKQIEITQSSGNSKQFENIIDHNLQHLEEGISQAIEKSIKSLEEKPVTDFQKVGSAKPVEMPKVESKQQLKAEAPSILENLPLITSEVVLSENQENEAVSQMKEEINEQPVVEIKVHEPLQEEHLVNNSMNVEEKANEQLDMVPQSPKTPDRPHNANLQNQHNRTIPETDPAQEQSFEQGASPLKPLGQYRQQQYQNGGRYCGFIYNGQRNSQGTFFYKDGGYYQGQWKDNAMNGYGRLYYDNGSLAYEGQWYHDEFHGRGKVYNDSASEITGVFDFRTFQNYQYFWKMYDGDLSHDIKEGHGKLVLSNNEHYVGRFRGDLPDGEGYFHTKDQVVHGVWTKGKLVKEF